MKVLHFGPEIAGNMGRLTRVLRQRGIEAVSCQFGRSWLGYGCDIQRDSWPDEGFIRHAMEYFDLFHFHFLTSFRPDLSDLKMLKDAGKRIVFSYWGSDQRGAEYLFYQQQRFFGHQPPKPYTWSRDMYKRHKLIDQYADAVFGYECIPRGQTFYGLIDPEEWTLEERDRLRKEQGWKYDPSVLRVLHAPSDGNKKMTPWILAELERLKGEGLPLEVVLVKGVPHHEVKKMYATCDVAVDQIGVGAFGLFGCEAMLWEMPVIVYQNALYDRIMGDNPPVWRLTAPAPGLLSSAPITTLGEWLKFGIEYLSNEELSENREWTLANRSVYTKIGEMIDVYNRVMEEGRLGQTANPQWFRQEEAMLRGEKSRFYQWCFDNKVLPPETGYDRSLYE